MNVVYAIVSIIGWVWCVITMAFLFFKLPRHP